MAGTFEFKDFQAVQQLLLAVMQQLVGHSIVFPGGLRPVVTAEDDPDAAAMAIGWLWLLDSSVGPHHFRTAIERLNPPAPSLQALARYLSRKQPFEERDTERLEWLVTHMVRAQAREGGATASSEILRNIERWMEQPSQPLSGTADALLTELVEILEDIVSSGTLRELAEAGLLDRGRGVKRRFRQDMAHPRVLAAVVNYNLVSRKRYEALLAEALSTGEKLPEHLHTSEYQAAAADLRQWNSAQQQQQAEAAVVPANLTQTIALLGIDTGQQEARIAKMLADVVSFVRASGGPADRIPLPHGSIPLAPWEQQALLTEYPLSEKSFRAEQNRALRRAAALMACIEEERTQYENHRTGEHLWKRHFDSLVYLLHVSRDCVAALQKVAQRATAKGLKEKAEQVGETSAALKDRSQQIERVYLDWKSKAAAAG